jgi:8-oxo-dGTP pyrophosphatase MutT (NUDIX family)
MKTTSPGTIGVVFDERREKILLHQLRDIGIWSLPGGRPDFGETFIQTVEREIHEETGLVVRAGRFIGAYSDPSLFTFLYPDGNEVHAFSVAIECIVIGGSIIRASEESVDVRWSSIKRLPASLMPRHRLVIQDALLSNVPVLR